MSNTWDFIILFFRLVLTQQFAEIYHSKKCRLNHDDGCSWFYENGENFWSQCTHQHYYEKAEKILEIVDFETAVKPN